MFSYIKIIKLYLFLILVCFLNLFSTSSISHEIKPSIADFTYDESYLNFKIRLNAELILSNIDASTVSNTDSSSLSEIYDKFRILSKKDLEEMFQNSWSEISSNIDIKINNETKKINLIKTEVDDIKNFEISRDTHVYFVLGIQHIIPKGLDHILFIFGLFLFSSSLKKLISQITIFTIAHSITLIFVSLSLMRINPQIVEPIIALSIVYIGLENIFKKYIKEYLRYVVILFFGLLHGLGFALVLSDIGYRSTDLFINLVSFNIGIEVAQISIVLVLYLLIALNFAKNKNYRILFQVPSYPKLFYAK